MATKHTPGPWYAKQVYDEWVVLWKDTSKGGVHMRRIDKLGFWSEANAKLAAAAPALLEACVAHLTDRKEAGCIAESPAIKRMRYAVKEATGVDYV